MDNFTFYSPTEFVFGKETEMKTGALLQKNNAKKVLIVYGGGSVLKSGLLDKIENSVRESNIEFVTLGGIQPNPVDTKVYEGIELGRKENIDFILAVGGGSVIDAAKAIAAGIPYDGDFWDFFSRKAVPEKAVKVGVVLTIPAAGSEGSGNTVITKLDGLKKLSLRTQILRPVFSVMNPELTYSLPPFQTACGIVDMIMHILERYFTNTPNVEISDRLSEATITTVINQGKIVMQFPDDYDARANIMWCGMIAHNGSVGVGRQEDWATHFLEHELSALYDVTHGAGLAVMLPAWLAYVSKINPEKPAQLAVRVFGVEDSEDKYDVAMKGVERIKEFFKSLDMPLTFAELGAKEEDIPLMVEKLHNHYDPTVGFYVKLKPEDSFNIYRMACGK